jgi:uncharacterized membrane protein YccC
VSLPELTLVGVREEPQARSSIRRTKGRAGLIGFCLVLLSSLHHGLTLETALVRALVGGIVFYFIGWAVAVAVWRQLLRARAREVIARAVAAREERRRK